MGNRLRYALTVAKQAVDAGTLTEVECFLRSEEAHWLCDIVGWGLYIDNAKVNYLGVGQDHATPVFLAKFVNKTHSFWHGYPVDHCLSVHDIPDTQVLMNWADNNLISMAKTRKIAKGQRCNP